MWPLVAAGYCHNRSSKLDAAASEEKLLNLRRVPRNSENKKKEDKRELPDGKENTTDLQKTETKSFVAEKDKRRSKSREEEEEDEEEEEEQQLQKQKVQTDYEEVGREKLRTVDTNPPGTLGILHLAGALTRKIVRCSAPPGREKNQVVVYSPISTAFFLFCSVHQLLSCDYLARVSSFLWNTRRVCMFVCFLSCANELRFGATITGRF